MKTHNITDKEMQIYLNAGRVYRSKAFHNFITKSAYSVKNLFGKSH